MLRFYGYFKESVTDSATENQRVRRCGPPRWSSSPPVSTPRPRDRRCARARAEPRRLRSCVLFYYLVDDSIYVAEPKTQNSGLPQGVFLMKRKARARSRAPGREPGARSRGRGRAGQPAPHPPTAHSAPSPPPA